MQTKRFIAADMSRALDLVRDEFGEDAMILSTQRTTKGVEIIATLEDINTPESPPASINKPAINHSQNQNLSPQLQRRAVTERPKTRGPRLRPHQVMQNSTIRYSPTRSL